MEFVKKIKLTAILLIISGSVLFAGSLSVGGEIGMDCNMVSTVTSFQKTSESPKFSFDVLIPVEYRINERFSVATGLHWAMRSSQYLKQVEDVENGKPGFATVDDYTNTRHFLEFPVTGRVYFELDPLEVFLGAGGYFGVYLGVYQNGSVLNLLTGSTKVAEFSKPESGNNLFSAGLLGEIGVKYALGPGDIYIVGRFSYGLTSLIKNQHDAAHIYFSNLTLGAGYTVRLTGVGSVGSEGSTGSKGGAK